MIKWLGIGLLLMLAGLLLLLAMVVGIAQSSLLLSLFSYAVLFTGVFCFTAGVLRSR